MRLNYYEFPEGVDPHTRYLNGASNKGGHCERGHTSCRGCDVCEGGWSECEHYYCNALEPRSAAARSLRRRNLLKKFGGRV